MLKMIVGGQFGSEGKGKVINSIIDNLGSDHDQYLVVRTGGANSGHTTKDKEGRDCIVKQLPSAIHDERAILCISAGCVINRDVLLEEISRHGINKDRLYIDPRAAIISEADRQWERENLVEYQGSTASGTGMAQARRMLRMKDTQLAGNDSGLCNLANVQSIAKLLQQAYGEDLIIVEGTQGYGLSLLHGVEYPFVTSRDVTASGFASEIGMPPCAIDEVIVTVRAYPIRVGGNSGPFTKDGKPSNEGELTWSEVGARAGAPEVEEEFTSVTQRLRRVAEFDVALVRDACSHNGADKLAIMGVDRLDHKCRGVKRVECLTEDVARWVKWVESECACPVGWIGTGPGNNDLIAL
jgi:adenylosuccinate synthase